MMFLKGASGSGNIDVTGVAQGRSPRLDSFAQDGDDGVEEATRGTCIEGRGDAERVQTCSVEDLVRVDVPNPCDQMLVEEHCFQWSLRSGGDSPNIIGGERVHDGIDPETVEFGQDRWTSFRIECDDLAESPRVDETQFCRMLPVDVDPFRRAQRQHDMAVRRPWEIGTRDQDLAAHSQMNHQLIAGVQCEQKVLSSPARIDRHVSGQSLDQFFSRGSPHSSLSTDLDAFDSPTDECDFETAPHGLDFGKFRHGPCRHRALRAQ
jgi:hypothetical protein